ncbi:Hypothetical protein FKW44_013384 [Caligus rogercresseyi]|uniref:Uncharacterized protein n=1 Tax=Caligus rogercresseyi TaxID=217165 RepID=A0A7T8KB83_CALRO|nr:Hypothetical protein FKW44_013384 [Caligus rogercresseyi]
MQLPHVRGEPYSGQATTNFMTRQNVSLNSTPDIEKAFPAQLVSFKAGFKENIEKSLLHDCYNWLKWIISL